MLFMFFTHALLAELELVGVEGCSGSRFTRQVGKEQPSPKLESKEEQSRASLKDLLILCTNDKEIDAVTSCETDRSLVIKLYTVKTAGCWASGTIKVKMNNCQHIELNSVFNYNVFYFCH